MIQGDKCLAVGTVLVRESGQMIFFFYPERKYLIEVISCNSTLFSEYVFGM